MSNNKYTKYKEESLALHKKHAGKWEVSIKMPLENQHDLTLAYSPGVADPCLAIQENQEDSFVYSARKNMVAVVSNGTAVLGLGNIGPHAAMPVMEGKAILFKKFGGIDAFPVCIDAKTPEEVIEFVRMLAPTVAGVNLEDIKAPECVHIERTLEAMLDIPVFHDDQHGTAIVVTAALLNAQRLTGKKLDTLTVVMSGMGAAGSSIARMIKNAGIKTIYGNDVNGLISKNSPKNFVLDELIEDKILTPWHTDGAKLADAFKGADVFIGVSAPGIVTQDMVRTMNPNPWVFALANPTPEIMPDLAREAGASIVGSGRSDFANQINNLLVFPGLFRGALDSRAKNITLSMKLAAAKALAEYVTDKELTAEHIIPLAMDKGVAPYIAKAVAEVVYKEQK